MPKVTIHHPTLRRQTRQPEGFAEALIARGWKPGKLPAQPAKTATTSQSTTRQTPKG